MADIRCPLCGKLNPADEEVCKYCKARLKPLRPSPFTSDNPSEQTGETPARKTTSQLEASLPDWLRDLRQEKDSTPSAGGEEPSEPGGASGEEGETDMPDWLTRIGDNSGSAGSAPFSEPPGEIPVKADSASDAEQLDVPDWLSGLGGNTFSGSTDSSNEPATEGNEPDWLQRIRAKKQTEEDEPTNPFSTEVGGEGTPSGPASAFGSSDSLPDWLSDLSSKEPASEPEPQANQDMPDWLSGLTPVESTQESDESPTDSIPDWLSGAKSPLTPEPSPEDSATPDWLAKLSGAAAFETPESDQPSFPEEPEAEEIPAAKAEPGEMPDWLSKLSAVPEEPASSGAIPALVFDDEDQSTGDNAPVEDTIEPESPLAALPDWISQVSNEASPESKGSEEGGEEGADITPGQLPNWLKAMQPVESAAPVDAVEEEETPSAIEKAGPLAGLKGVLPAEPEFANFSKPPSYSLKLQISDKQQANMSLLERLVASEKEPEPIVERAGISSQSVLKALIAVVMVAVILAVLILTPPGAGVTPLPSTNNDSAILNEVGSADAVIYGLPTNAHVLVSFDYTPGFSGEMEAVASAMVGSLVEKQARLAMVSTSTDGVMLAEHFMSTLSGNLKIDPRSVMTQTDTVNLGYIAGGAAGLAGFAANPQAVVPYAVEDLGLISSENVWSSSAVSGLKTLSDFDMVLVITDNPETARSWVEQVKPSLGGKPLLVASSAQADPMIRPYYQTNPRQIDGLVAGMAGAGAYENRTQHVNLATHYWDAYSAGVLAAAVLIVVGGLINIGLASMAARKQAGGEEAA